MNIENLFKPPKLSEEERKKYFYGKLEKEIEELRDQGYSGIDYKNRVYFVKRKIERQKENGVVSKYNRPSHQQKNIFHEHLITNELQYSFEIAKDIRYHLPESVRSHSDFINHISKVNLFSLVFPELQRFDNGGRQPCIFTNKNVGWISKGEKGYYRYFTKREQTGMVYGFSLLDLFEVAYGGEFSNKDIAYRQARTELALSLNCQYSERDFEIQQKQKYFNNLCIVENLKSVSESYPTLHRLIKNQLYVLQKLHFIAKDNIMEKRHSIKNEAVFFVSTTTLQKVFAENHNKQRQRSTIACAINLFVTLGLLNKIPSETLKKNETLFTIALNIRGGHQEYRFINFMTIPYYDEELLSKAEKIAKQLKKNKITTAKQITRSKLIEIFGIKKANEVIEAGSLMSLSDDALLQMAKLTSLDESFDESGTHSGELEAPM